MSYLDRLLLGLPHGRSSITDLPVIGDIRLPILIAVIAVLAILLVFLWRVFRD